MLSLLLAADSISGWQLFVQQCLNGLTYGALIALIALGYTMVYGIIGLINFAHGDLFMLGTFLTLTLIDAFGLNATAPTGSTAAGIVGLLVI
ncbi:MAG TPA: branched-chain amino acid ABC transporter permease, partial [Pirellulales bacterium]|nr:branched-chain amino acid ABC transporter permease [Pirellulales bacterium]